MLGERSRRRPTPGETQAGRGGGWGPAHPGSQGRLIAVGRLTAYEADHLVPRGSATIAANGEGYATPDPRRRPAWG